MLRAALVACSRSRTLRSLSLRPVAARRLARRFVAGTGLEEALDAARAMNAAGLGVTLNHLGESVTSEAEARRAAAVYHRLLDSVEEQSLDAHVSIKLTQMGLDVDPGLAEELAAGIAAHAARARNFVRVDMEGSPYTARTLDLVRRIHAQPGNAAAIGTVIQACLYRSHADALALTAAGVRVRLCKGAYKEPAAIAWPRKADVDASFLRLMKLLLSGGVPAAIATHDERMIRAAIEYAAEEHIGRRSFEFQMLYGIRRDLQAELARQGYCVRVYTPFGTEWYPYFMRRLAERPANTLFVLKNLFRR